MNYLNLCNAVAHRLNEVAMTSSNFTTATGFHSQIKDAVQFAIRDINHAEYEWPFNMSAGTLVVTSGTPTYALTSAAPNFIRVDWDSFVLNKNVPTSAVTAKPLPYIDFDLWRQRHKANDINTAPSGWSTPDWVYRTQQEEVGFSPYPDKNYSISFDYWLSPSDLSAATDSPTIYDRFSHIIIDGAMWYCYMFRDNVEAATVMEKKFTTGIKRMRVDLINRFDSFRSDYVYGRGAYGNDPSRF